MCMRIWIILAGILATAGGYALGISAADPAAFRVTTLDAPSGAAVTRLRISGEENPADAVFENATVGIGVANPAESLEVDGAVKLGPADGAADGTIRWTGSDLQGRKGGTWVSLTAPDGMGPPVTSPAVVQFGAATDDRSRNPGFFYPSSGDWVTSADEVKMRVPRAGTIRNMYVKIRINSIVPATATKTYSLRKNGVDTALSVTFGDGVLEIENTSAAAAVAVAAGDAISVSAVSSPDMTGDFVQDVFIQFEFAD